MDQAGVHRRLRAPIAAQGYLASQLGVNEEKRRYRLMLALTCTSPDPMDEGRHTVQRLFEQYVPKGMPVTAAWMPAWEVTERDGKLTVRCDMPGVEPSEIGVSVTDGRLTISGERKVPAPSDDQWVRGLTHGNFARTFTLPDRIEASSLKTIHVNGVLSILLPLQSVDRNHADRPSV
jgi:HSP20 family molecular chaperone IbpA